MKDFLVILRRNFLSPIVIAILVLALILLILNQPRDAWFVSVVIVLNTSLAIIQETRARSELRKLELMSAPVAHLLESDGSITDTAFDQLKIDDIVQLNLGDEVPADGLIVTSAGLELDESILTGESAPVEKPKGSTAYAASAVVAGAATIQITAVGINTKIGSMTTTLKRYVPQMTPTQTAIARAITWLTYGALALAVAIIVIYSLSGHSAVQIFKTITSSAITIIPEGLLLGSSLLLAFGSIRLAKAQVLPQKLAAIEAMALLNVLCVDKTGTLTSDEITFEKFELFDKSAKYIPELIGVAAFEAGSNSATNQAIASAFPVPSQYKVLQTLAFSSRRKLSGVKLIFSRKTRSIIVGAPEYVGKLAPLSSDQKQQIDTLAGVGKRVLLVATFDGDDISLKDLSVGSGRAVGVIILSNELREGAKKTVAYLQKNGVSLRVISGDNPDTVKYIAGQAGIKNYQTAITGAELQAVSDDDWDETVAKTTIFARVLPEQKERLVETFKRLGNFTGMVGDGVNDALALKKADLGVAMYAGATATRRVADIVLLNNSFNSLPIGMKLGNRIMQAIEMIATLFFHKIIFSVLLLLATLALGVVYPFLPRHITFMNMFLVTIPTVIWTLLAPSPRYRLSPRFFWRDTLQAVAPIAILSGIAVTVTYLSLLNIHPEDTAGVLTTTVIVSTFFGIYLVFLVPLMFDVKNTKKARLARLFYVLAVAIIVVPSFRFSFIRDFFDFTMPAWERAWPLLLMIVCVVILQWQIALRAGYRLKRHES